jgi:hypothetical protein
MEQMLTNPLTSLSALQQKKGTLLSLCLNLEPVFHA